MNLADYEEERILDRAEYIEEAVSILADQRDLSLDEYKNDRTARAVVEREFHTAIEACIDIAGILIGASDQGCLTGMRGGSQS